MLWSIDLCVWLFCDNAYIFISDGTAPHGSKFCCKSGISLGKVFQLHTMLLRKVCVYSFFYHQEGHLRFLYKGEKCFNKTQDFTLNVFGWVVLNKLSCLCGLLWKIYDTGTANNNNKIETTKVAADIDDCFFSTKMHLSTSITLRSFSNVNVFLYGKREFLFCNTKLWSNSLSVSPYWKITWNLNDVSLKIFVKL